MIHLVGVRISLYFRHTLLSLASFRNIRLSRGIQWRKKNKTPLNSFSQIQQNQRLKSKTSRAVSSDAANIRRMTCSSWHRMPTPPLVTFPDRMKNRLSGVSCRTQVLVSLAMVVTTPEHTEESQLLMTFCLST